MKTALYYRSLPDKVVQCFLCPHFCLIPMGKRGLCRGRSNRNGFLYADNYAKAVALNLDPIEKKPLYHYHPGSQILSTGANSCNMNCIFCQNSEISQCDQDTMELETQDLIDLHETQQIKQIAFTYTEPLTWFEYILFLAQQLSPLGIEFVLVSNGQINPEPLRDLIPFLAAANIDLKAMNSEFYRSYCNGYLESVLASIESIFNAGIHLEITNLLIPGLNLDHEKIASLVDFIAGLSPDIPLHFSAYHPAHKCALPKTEQRQIISACKSASKRLNYVYAGNVSRTEFSDTRCPECKMTLIERKGLFVNTLLVDKLCPRCSATIYGVF